MDTASTTPASVTPDVSVPSMPAPADTSIPPIAAIPPVIPSTPAPKKSGSWGTVIAIVLILAVVVVGAFYAWGKRIAETERVPVETAQ